MIWLQAPIPAAAVRDTIARLLRDQGYQRSATSTLWTRFWDWLGEMVRELFATAASSRGTYIISLVLVGGAIVAAIARAVIVARARTLAAAQRAVTVTWQELSAEADGLARQEAYAAAAHALYAAVILRLAADRRVRPHPSKTVGDYWRELRLVADPNSGAYRAFAGTYESVVYGDGVCDRERFARLRGLAAPLLAAAADPTAARAA